MSFKEKAVSWRQEVHIGKTKPRLIKAAILLLCFGILIGMAWYYSEFSAKDCVILAGICVLTLAIYMIDMPVHPVIRILFALVIPLGCFYTFETLTHQMSTMIELAKRLNIAFYYWLFLFVFFIAGRTSISMAICVSAIAIIGVGNYFVVMFRSNPIVPWDIYSFETAMSVADNYVFSVDWALAEHIAMFILMLIVGVRTNIRLNKKILRPILTVAMCIPAYFYISYLWQDNLERNTGLNDTLFNAKYMHSKDGFFVSFILDIHFLQIEEPKNYSDEYALSLLNEQEVEKVETPEELPDIIAIMDETDSGLDIDALRIVSKGVNKLKGPDFGLLVITHYERILNYIKPDHLHILLDGKIVLSGGPELVKELEKKGYDWVREQFGQEVLAT